MRHATTLWLCTALCWLCVMCLFTALWMMHWARVQEALAAPDGWSSPAARLEQSRR